MLMKKTLIGLATALILSAIQPTSADADEGSFVLKRIKERGVINMGHREASVPFAYIGDDGKPQGYHIDICNAFIDKIKDVLKKPDLQVKHVPITSQTRLALIANGTIDMACGSATNNLTRQKQVDYLPVTFIAGTKLGHKKGSGIKEIEDLNGKSIALQVGTTNEKAIKRAIKEKNLDIRIVPVKDHPQGWLAVNTGRVDAYGSDDVLIYGLISKSKDPDAYQVTGRYLSYDPYGIMVPRNDSTYRRIGTEVVADLMRDGKMLEIYNKWFNPGKTNMKMPISDKLQAAFEIQALPY